MHGVSQVGDHEIVVAHGRSQCLQTLKPLHRSVSPLNRIQIGFCHANAELTASWIAPSILATSLTVT